MRRIWHKLPCHRHLCHERLRYTQKMSLDITFLLYPGVTQLDLTGPFEVLSRLPEARIHLVWKSLEPVFSDSGLILTPTSTFEKTRGADVLCVPGGAGQIDLMEDKEVIDFIRQVGTDAPFVTSVCVGSFLLGAAGLLEGYRATTHWASLPLLSHYGAQPVSERVVRDRNRITGGGVTAGIDLALAIVETIVSPELTEQIRLGLEYDPPARAPGGHPRSARPAITEGLKQQFAGRIARRETQGRAYRSRSV
jgi:cyclohexyl-isocyanide hydratase